ncbi:hypothetical protein REPUB_Repub15cG0080400 [Reevesia pubescens]
MALGAYKSHQLLAQTIEKKNVQLATYQQQHQKKLAEKNTKILQLKHDLEKVKKILEESELKLNERETILTERESSLTAAEAKKQKPRQFNIKRGLRQGCPLSPLLFNLVAESFSVLANKAISENLFNRISFGDNTVSVSHLQYVDDTIIFCKASLDQLLNVRRLIRCFQAISGLKINFKKSMLFSTIDNLDPLEDWASIVGCKVGAFPTTYLGLPLRAKRNSLTIWKPLLKKVEKKPAVWKSRFLSIGGKVTLLKSVISSLPIFFMSIFQIPKGVKNYIYKLQRRFL